MSKTVLCHGVFDIVHPGHLEHLRQARSFGDKLVVAIVADAYVRKGLGRPIFNQHQRAQFLANLKIVDEVIIVESPLALPALESLKPAVFCKGPDYASPNHMFATDFQKEKTFVESYGGKVMLTAGFTASTTELIGKEPKLNRLAEIEGYLKNAQSARVFVIGEPILDRYIYVRPLGKSAKDNIVSFEPIKQVEFHGGGWIIAKDAESFSAETIYSTWQCYPIIKLRYVEQTFMTKLFEIVERHKGFNDYNLFPIENDFDILLIADYGHGLFQPEVIRAICSSHAFLALMVQSNSSNWGFNLLTKWPRADYVVVDREELRLARHDQYAPIEELAYAEHRRLGTKIFAVTLGHEGCLVLNGGELIRAPAVAEKVVDRMGAGDAFLAATTPLAWSGAPAHVIAEVGNIAGAIKVGKVGNQAITLDEVRAWLRQRYL